MHHDPHTHKNSDEQMDTTECFTFPTNAVGKIFIVLCAYILEMLNLRTKVFSERRRPIRKQTRLDCVIKVFNVTCGCATGERQNLKQNAEIATTNTIDVGLSIKLCYRGRARHDARLQYRCFA